MTGLSVVFPAYREERRLPGCLDAATEFLRGRDGEIVVVDDGSPDGTRALAERRAAGDPRILVHALPRNRGKGAAVREGVLRSRGRVVLVSDVDLATPLSEFDRLEPLLQRAAVVVGSRALAGAKLEARESWRREVLGRFFNAVARVGVLPGILDTQCGFKIWRGDVARAVFRRVRLERFAFDVESLWLARRMGHRVIEAPVTWRHDEGSTVRVGRDGLRMGTDLLRLVLRRTLPY